MIIIYLRYIRDCFEKNAFFWRCKGMGVRLPSQGQFGENLDEKS